MIKPHIIPEPAAQQEKGAVGRDAEDCARSARWKARYDLARHRARTERLRVLADFLARPIHAHGGADPDPDVVTAYNLAVEAALQGIRRAAQGAED